MTISLPVSLFLSLVLSHSVSLFLLLSPFYLLCCSFYRSLLVSLSYLSFSLSRPLSLSHSPLSPSLSPSLSLSLSPVIHILLSVNDHFVCSFGLQLIPNTFYAEADEGVLHFLCLLRNGIMFLCAALTTSGHTDTVVCIDLVYSTVVDSVIMLWRQNTINTTPGSLFTEEDEENKETWSVYKILRSRIFTPFLTVTANYHCRKIGVAIFLF